MAGKGIATCGSPTNSGNSGNDLRYTIRRLRSSPGFSLVAVLTLALGIGANTSAFSIMNAVLLRPLPYLDSGQLDRIFRVTAQSSRGSVSPADYLDLKAWTDGYGDIAGLWRDGNQPRRTRQTSRDRAAALRISANFFSTLGSAPELGRDFRPDEETAGNHRVLDSQSPLLAEPLRR